MLALVDDIVLYKAACCGVIKEWYVSCRGDIQNEEPLTYKEARDLVKANEDYEMFHEEVDRGLKSCIFAFNQILNRVKNDTECDDYLLILSDRHSKTFRYDIAKTKPYKAQRGDKPKYYDQLYDEVLKKYNCMIATNRREVDDELGILQTKAIMEGNETIICTSDKDLRQIPGTHYNLDTKEIYQVGREGTLSIRKKKVYGTGLKWFYAQMLLGDTADNIPGVKAKNIPGEAKLKDQRIIEGLSGSLEQCEEYVYQCYIREYNGDALERMTEIGRLLRMLTVEDTKYWEPEYVHRS